MNKTLFFVILVFLSASFGSLFSQETEHHKHKKENVNLNELNRKYDQAWDQWRKKLFGLNIKSGMKVGEVGCGKGEFAFLLAERVGDNGHIYANEIDEDKLSSIKKIMEDEKLKNMTPVLGEINDPRFPVSDLEAGVMVEVFHHLDNPGIFFKTLKKYIKPGAKFYIIDPDVNQKFGSSDGCYSDPAFARELSEAAGYKFVDLKWNTVMDLKFYILTVENPSDG